MEEKKWGDSKPLIPNRPRKWDIKDIEIKLNNLKKLIGVWAVETEIKYQKQYTDNAVDYLNMAYYALKQRYSRIHIWRYGNINNVEYEPKLNKLYSFDLDNVWNEREYTWTITTNSISDSPIYTSTVGSFYYNYNRL